LTFSALQAGFGHEAKSRRHPVLVLRIYYFRVSAYSILESEYSNSGIVNATGYDASYSFVSADVSATVDLVWNVDNSTDVSYITISSKTGISELDISGGVDYYIRTDADDITPLHANDHRFFKLGYRQFERPDIVDGSFTSVDVRWSSTDSSQI
jgi:hypothetical protein